MYKDNPGLHIMKLSSNYENYVEAVTFDSYHIKCILQSNEAYRLVAANCRLDNRPRFSV